MPTCSSSRAPWACSTAFPPPPPGPARRPTSPRGFGLPVLLVIDVAGQSQSAAAVRARLRRSRPRRADRRRRAEPRRQRAARAGWWPTRSPRSTFPILGAIPRDADARRCPSAISAWCRPASTRPRRAARTARRHGRASSRSRCDQQLAAPPHRSAARLDAPVPPPGAAHRAGAGRRLQLRLPACAGRMAAARAPRSCPFSPLADEAPPERVRQLLASRRLSGASRRDARRRRSVPRRPRALRRDAAGAWRVRRLHGARREPRGRRRHQPPHGSGCSAMPPASRKRKLHLGYRQARLLSDSPLGQAGDALARARVPLCGLDSPRAATSRWSSLPTARARYSARQADGGATSPAPSSTPSPRC